MIRPKSLPFLFSLIIPMVPASALAIPTITCHCFTDRSYDPARPCAADSYFLATTQNTFFSAVFGVEKKTVVMKKQAGASSDDLWVAYWIASRTGREAENLLQTKQVAKTWNAALASRRIGTNALGSRFQAALKATTLSSRLADAVVDDLMLRYQLAGTAELESIRRAGGSNQELIIATLIETRMRQPAGKLIHEVKSGNRSWGDLLQSARINVADLQGEMSGLLRLHTK